MPSNTVRHKCRRVLKLKSDARPRRKLMNKHAAAPSMRQNVSISRQDMTADEQIRQHASNSSVTQCSLHVLCSDRIPLQVRSIAVSIVQLSIVSNTLRLHRYATCRSHQ